MVRNNASIRVRLLKWLVIPLILLSMIGGYAVYWLSWLPARNAYDLALANMAWQLALRQQDSRYGLVLDIPIQMEVGLRSSDRYDQIFFAIHSRNGIWLAGDRGLPYAPIPHNIDKPVFYDGDYGGLPVRLVSLPTRPSNELIIVTVAETKNKRTSGQRTIMLTLVSWGGALIIIITASIWIAIGLGLAPLNRLRAEIQQRSLRDLAPLRQDNEPVEVAPLVSAINELLERIEKAAKTQQVFLADVAHQLRTPLAGLITQLAVAQKYTQSPELQKSITLMQTTAGRAARLANQMLSLARAEHSAFHAQPFKKMDLMEIAQDGINNWLRLADQKNIDISFKLSPAYILGSKFLICELLDNIVFNAIQYTPENGRIIVGCSGNSILSQIYVEDSGPGIPESERALIFQRFYRITGTTQEGSGLGLTIAREIALDHDAEIFISTPLKGFGTRVEIRFQAA